MEILVFPILAAFRGVTEPLSLPKTMYFVLCLDQSLACDSQAIAWPYQAIRSINQSIGYNSNENFFKTYTKTVYENRLLQNNLENKESGQKPSNRLVPSDWIFHQSLASKRLPIGSNRLDPF